MKTKRARASKSKTGTKGDAGAGTRPVRGSGTPPLRSAYVSSTYLDLKDHRQRAERVLRRMGYLDVAMEYYVAEDQRSLDRCLADVAACDLYIGLFAWRYGWEPPHEDGRGLSITEREYRLAVELGKPRLLFLLDEAAPWPLMLVDDDRTRIRNLRADLAADRQPALFSSPDILEAVLSAALSRLALPPPTPPPGGAPWPHAGTLDRDGYRAAMMQLHRFLDFEALVEPRRDELLRLQLRSVFVEPNVRATSPPLELPKSTWERLVERGEMHPDDLPAGVAPSDLQAAAAYRQEPARPALAALADPGRPHAILLGDPGAGKSTVARFVLLSLLDPDADAAPALRQGLTGYLPLLIELKTYAALCAQGLCQTFVEFVDHMARTEGWRLTGEALARFLAEDGRVLAIFDGVDEIVDPAERERISRQIAGFASDHRRARVLATSRVIGYRRKLLADAGFVHLTLEDLDEGQVASFAASWYALVLPDRPVDARQRTERVLAAFRQSASIRQLAGNPMLLTIMAIIGRHQELPRERWQLYDHAASVLLQHWDVNKHLRDRNVAAEFIGEDDKKELLRRLAYRMQAGGAGFAGNYIPSDLLQQEFETYLRERYAQTPDRAALAARALIAELRERNFILSLHGANLYGFVHRAFLEYFCATALVHRFEKTRELSLDDLKRDVYGAHWSDPAWQEVLRLTCGMLAPRFAGELIAYLTSEVNEYWTADPEARPPQHLVLAVQCLAEVKRRQDVAEVCAALLRAVVSMLEFPWTLRPLVRAYSNVASLQSALEEVGGDWAAVDWFGLSFPAVIDVLYPPFQVIYVALALSTLRSEGLRRRKLDELLASRRIGARRVAVSLLSRSSEAGVRELVEQRALADESSHVRSVALDALARTWSREADVRQLVARRAREDEADHVRAGAVTTLARTWPREVGVRELVQERALEDEDPWVRASALEALAGGWPGEAGVRELVEQRAIEDSGTDHRWIAVEALARTWPQEVRARELLERRALADEDEVVRAEALTVLAQHWPQEIGVRDLVVQRTLEDDAIWVRVRALQVLAGSWPQEAGVRELVERLALRDEDPNVRSSALQALANSWPQEAGVRNLVEQRAVEDEDQVVRGQALAVLARGWPRKASVRRLIEQRCALETGDVRLEALVALARSWPQEESVRQLVGRRALEDDDPFVRRQALWILARGWPRAASTRQILKRAVEDSELSVRQAALGRLLEIGTDLMARLILSAALDGRDPFLDPRDPISFEHLDKAAALLDTSVADLEARLLEWSRALGWDLRDPFNPIAP